MSTFTDKENAYFAQIQNELATNKQVSLSLVLPKIKREGVVWEV